MPPKTKKKTVNGYKMPDPLPKGLILEDIAKKNWKLGGSIGIGGFGEIYEAQDVSVGGTKYPYVIKIEPHENGPLFVEMHFYMRVAKKPDIEAFASERKLKMFGMPPYFGSGSHEYKGEKYRFLVMEKYGSDIWKLYLANNKRFPESTVFKLGLQILDVLEYIHSKEYVHADIKGANILLGLSKETANQVYLVDFGLATRYSTNKEFKPDPKKAHNGTIEYLSRDAHKGVPTRRGDLEILLYNFIHWLGCKLPWENCLNTPVAVEESKNKHFDGNLLSTCFEKQTPPKALVEYFTYIKKLDFNSQPDYSKLRTILTNGLKASGGDAKGPLVFKSSVNPKKRASDVGTGESSPEKKRKIAAGSKKVAKAKTATNTKKISKSKKAVESDIDEVSEDNINSETTDNNENEDTITEETVKEVKPKKQGRKPAVTKEDTTGNASIKKTKASKKTKEISEEEEVKKTKATQKKTVKKVAKEKNGDKVEETNGYDSGSDSDSGLSTMSETAEMRRIREKIELKNGNKKKPAAKRKVKTPTKKAVKPVKKANKSEKNSENVEKEDGSLEENKFKGVTRRRRVEAVVNYAESD